MKSLSLAVAFAALLGAGAAQAAPAVIKLDPLRERLRTVKVTVNGQAGEFLLDTGGGTTQLSPDFAKKIGCKPWGRMTGYTMMGDRVDMPRCEKVQVVADGTPLATVTAGVLDVTPYLQPGATPPDGVLSLDALRGQAFTLEVRDNKLTIEDAASLAKRIEGARELPLRISREAAGSALDMYVGFPTEKGTLWLILDSGAGGVLLIAKDMAGFFNLKTDVEGPQPLRFELAPGVPVEGPALTPAMILDGNLGMPFMKNYVLTVDLKAERLWIKPVA